MILLDTHAWIWWVHRDPRLPTDIQAEITEASARSALSAVNGLTLWRADVHVRSGRTFMSGRSKSASPIQMIAAAERPDLLGVRAERLTIAETGGVA